jgi:hypothetical protein
VQKCLKKKDPQILVFESHQTLARVDKLGDLFEPVLTLKQKLPGASSKLAKVTKPKRVAGAPARRS